MSRLFQLRAGMQSLLLHKLRSLLTILGVVFGVASVVSMLAVGEGASHDVRQQLLRFGPDRIIVRSVRSAETPSKGGDVMVYGVTREDQDKIRELIPGVTDVACTYELVDKEFWARDQSVDAPVVGTTPEFAHIQGLTLQDGRFLSWPDHERHGCVAVLGAGIAMELFQTENPVGQFIKHSTGYYKVVGVLAPAYGHKTKHDPDQSIYIPFTTAKGRFEYVARIVESGAKRYERIDLHEISFRVAEMSRMPEIVPMVKQILAESHPHEDYELVVPFELLKEMDRTKRVFNAVLGSIGGISLLVGGIGIMNIMLATVSERTREIGVRRALGAKRRDIIVQFLIESAILSSVGGVLGLGLGVLVPTIVSQITEVKTIITGTSLVLALAISIAVGIIFGVYPARKAAAMEPVEALRHT